jgi:flagellar biosynthesis chaperone FliJ
MFKQLRSSIQRWDSLAEGVGLKLQQVQKALIILRDKQSELDHEQSRLVEMKLEYASKLKEVQALAHDFEKVTYLRRFLGQLDTAAKSIRTELELLGAEHNEAQQQFQSLNSEQLKFTTLAARSRKQLKEGQERLDQKDQDMMNLIRFEGLKR